MREIPPHAVQAAVRAVLGHPWGSGPWTAHGAHERGRDAECAVCRGDVEAILAVALQAAAPLLAEHIARLIEANVHGDAQDRGGWLSPSPCMAYVDGHDNAARIARGAFGVGERSVGDAPVRACEAPQGDSVGIARDVRSPDESRASEGRTALRGQIARVREVAAQWAALAHRRRLGADPGRHRPR
ncbi:hypothetical protein Ssi03_50820 [Sphaerisporangium siamense]|uniref:Uncharacterized protein n=1 Tax=Sphaerisporangium siamense TaxID=795645 RepID=A0A7W7D907_9ACTN|nr:hypothetical protein [Sphaerisporangium siamense]MBB4702214.1 hypothetical protein [Sphaerisporangium siamense]GII87092.1 hypothetical protein Ssi03_50820 [Sphaerisporangium siamense]